ISLGKYDNKPQPAYLTIVDYKNNGFKEEIIPEFYCQNCANDKLKEIGKELTNFSILENGLAASMERSAE
ncbi:7582_t:CDS:1, partial [Cetraspora pellucida]